MSEKPILVAGKQDEGQRIDNFIFKNRRRADRGTLYKLFRKGQIRLNGKRCKPEVKLCVGDEVRLPPFLFFVERQKAPEIDVVWQQRLQRRVLFRDEDYLLLDKPAGLPCHTGSGHQFGVVEVVRSLPEFADVQLAHRLDVGTSGCLLLALNRPALLGFQQAMQSLTVEKVYLAVVHGRLEQAQRVALPLDTEHRVNGVRTVRVDAAGKAAVTWFEPLAYHQNRTLLQCRLEHGRTHQVRVHAQAIGHPLLGDVQYGSSVSEAERIYLHAHRLSFANRQWQCAMPQAFARLFPKSG